MLKSLFRKILTKRWGVKSHSKYDFLNKADEVRGKKASHMILVNKLNVDKVLNSPNPLETDINRAASAFAGPFDFQSKIRGSLSNLITVSIIKDQEIGEEYVEVVDTNIIVHCSSATTNLEVSTLILNSPPANSLIIAAVLVSEEDEVVDEIQGVPLLGGA